MNPSIPYWRSKKKLATMPSLLALVALSFSLYACSTWRETPGQMAERAWQTAETLRAQQGERSGREALGHYERASTLWSNVGNRRSAAIALKEIGDLHVQWSEGKEALVAYRKALAVVQNANAPLEEAAISNGLCAAYILLGKNDEAMQWLECASQLSERNGHHRERARAWLNRAELAYAKGDRLASLPDYERAYELFACLQDINGMAQASLLHGHAYNDLGRRDDALRLFTHAQSLWEKSGDIHGRALSLIALGHWQVIIGNGRQAKTYYERARPLIEQTGDKFWQASLSLGLSKIYSDMRRDEWALPLVEKSLAIYQRLEDVEHQASTLLTTGLCLRSLGRLDEALVKLDQAEHLATPLGDNKTLIIIKRERGAIYAEKGEFAQAQALFQEVYQAHVERGERSHLAKLLKLSGQAYLKEGESKAAAQKFQEGVQQAQASSDRLEEAELRYGLALIENASGRWGKGAELIKQVIDLAEEQRRTSDSAALRTTYFEHAQNYFELYIDLLVKQGKFQQAFEVSEQARAREFNALLSEADVQLVTDKQSLPQDKQLLDEIVQQEKRVKALPRNTAQRSAAENELQRLRAERDELESEARGRQARTQVVQATAKLRLAEVQRQLPDKTVLLEYALGKDRSHLWVITQNSLQHHDLPPRATIESLVSRVSEDMRQISQAPEWTAAAELSRLLLKPVEADLLGKRLLIVASGALHALPFAALPLSVSPKGEPEWLIARNEMNYLPSAATLLIGRQLLQQRHAPPNQVAVLADAIYSLTDNRVSLSPATKKQAEALAISPKYRNDQSSLERLHFANDEAEYVSKLSGAQPSRLWLGEDANLAAAKSPELAAYRIVHFAAHGKVLRETPELSALIFSLYDEKGVRQDAELLVADIYNLRFKADLIVLSACDTALGKGWRGEGVEGLSRAFMHAGAARVMASLWKVDDEATAELMKRFYDNHFNRSMPIAKALRQAQLSLMTEPKWNHPAYWAGFVLQSGVQ